MKDKSTALKCRESLISNGISTKILPEAYTWHFAATWNHITEMYEDWEKFIDDLNPSKEIIEKAVSLPITINFSYESTEKIYKSVKDVL